MVEQLYDIIAVAVDFFDNIPTYFAWLPSSAAAVVGLICFVALAFRILGWGD